MAFQQDKAGRQISGNALELEGKSAGEPLLVTMTHASRRPALSIGTEAADVIVLTVQLKDGNDVDVDVATNIVIHLVDANGLDELVGAFTLGDSGAGSVVSTTGKPRLLYLTDANGVAEIDVTDVAGASGLTTYALVQVVSGSTWIGGSDFIAIPFD